MLTLEIHTHAKYPARIGGSYESITGYRHRCIKPQILHQKFTYLHQLVYHTFNRKIYSTKYIKEYKAACLNHAMSVLNKPSQYKSSNQKTRHTRRPIIQILVYARTTDRPSSVIINV
jgi:hypothetical protein